MTYHLRDRKKAFIKQKSVFMSKTHNKYDIQKWEM